MFEYGLVAFLFLIIGSVINTAARRLPIIIEKEWRSECRAYLDSANDGLVNASGLPGYDEQNLNGLDLVFVETACDCGYVKRFYERIPVISWILSQGRCSSCGKSEHYRNALIELLVGSLSLCIVLQFGFTLIAAYYLLLVWITVVSALIDHDTMIVPDVLVLPLIWLGLLVSAFGISSVEPSEAIIGAALGYAFLWVLSFIYQLVHGSEGLGQGDFKLMAVFGAALGSGSVPAIILISAILSLFCRGVFWLRSGDLEAIQPFAFGPYIVAAGAIKIITGDGHYLLMML